MTSTPDRRVRAGLVVPTLFALVALGTFVSLGTWQVQRKAWKEGLIDTLERRLTATPVDLPAPDHWAHLDSADDEFRRVKFSAAFVPGAEALVYAGSSALRTDVAGPGYWVFSPARLQGGATVVINRGFVPEGRQAPATRTAGVIMGTTELVGAMRWPEAAGLFAPKNDPAHNLWFVRDPVAIAATKGWGEVAPFFVELESPQAPGGLPQAGVLKASLRNEHLQYAITWFGLAVVVGVMFLAWLGARWRGADPI
jgi:surfeit locus 1 family protein